MTTYYVCKDATGRPAITSRIDGFGQAIEVIATFTSLSPAASLLEEMIAAQRANVPDAEILSEPKT